MDESKQQQKVTEFTIDRSKWLRGQGSEKSRLLRPSDGKMCCLGFYALACGLKPEEIEERDTPKNAGAPYQNCKQAAWLFHHCLDPLSKVSKVTECSGDCYDLMSANDDKANENFTEEEREKAIVSTFAANGVTVKFIDGT